jgi:hypothetical protein
LNLTALHGLRPWLELFRRSAALKRNVQTPGAVIGAVKKFENARFRGHKFFRISRRFSTKANFFTAPQRGIAATKYSPQRRREVYKN